MRNYDETMTNEQARLKSGDSSLLDTILTEQQATSARLSYIAAQQEYASLLAMLRHEAGLLVQDGTVDGIATGDGPPGSHSKVSDGRPPDDSPRAARRVPGRVGRSGHGAAPPPAAAPISLAEGVRQALEKAYLVQLAREDVNVQQATVRQARGAFDSVLQIGPLFEHREDDIENTVFFNPERVKRGFAGVSTRDLATSPTLWGNRSARAAAIFRFVRPTGPSAVTS